MILVTAAWCAPCNALKDWIEVTENGEGIAYLDVDYDELPFDIRSIPSLVVDNSVFVGNEEIRPFLSSLNLVEI